MKPKYHSFLSSFLPANIALSLGLVAVGIISSQSAQAANGADTWTSGGTANWSVSGNWTGTNTPPIAGDSIVFGTTTGATTLNDDLAAALNIVGITFNTGASGFTIAGSSITLGGDITDNATNAEVINDALILSATHNVTVASGGSLALGGAISGGTYGITKLGAGTLTLSGANSNTGTTTITAGTLKLGAGNALTTTGNVSLGTGGITNIFDLAGYSQTIGTLSSGGTTDSAGIITSSTGTGTLTLNEGGTTGNPFGGTRFTGTLALTIVGVNNTAGGNNYVQLVDPNNTFSGGLTLKSSSANSLSTANLANGSGGGGITGASLEALNPGAAAELGSGTITLDNGSLIVFGLPTITNNLALTARGGVLHNENNTATYSGNLSSSGTTLLVLNSNSGNNHTFVFSGADSGFSGTIALDTSNIGGLKFTGSATGNSSTNLLWYGNGTNGGTGTVSLDGNSGATYTFGELNNNNSGAVGSTQSGKIQNYTGSTTATLSIGDSNATAATFQGVIQNGTGTVALAKTGTNTQILSGASTYTGATTINGGTLQITGSLASGSAVAVNNSGTLIAGGTVACSVAVNGGGTLGGTGTVSGAVTVAGGGTSATQGQISLVDGGVGTLTVSNAAGLTLGGTAGNLSLLNFEANSSTSDKISLGSHVLTIGAGGANITITSLGVVSNATYNLMSFGSGAGAGFATGSGATTIGGLTLTNPSLSFGVSGTLTVSSTAVQLVTTGASAPASAYWSGAKGGTWASDDGVGGNFTTTDGGGTFVSAYPAATSDVFFTNSSAVTNTLGAGFDIKSLTFSGAGTSAINSDSNILTIESGGLAVQSGAGAVSIAATVAGPGAVTNAGTLTLSGPNTYSGGTTNTSGTLTAGSPTAFGASTGALAVNGGTVDLNGNSVSIGLLSGSGGSITNNSSSANVTLTENNSSTTTFAGALNNGSNGKTLALAKAGSGTLILSGSNNYSGGTSVSLGTLQLGSSAALGSGAASVTTGGTLDLSGQTIGNALTILGTGVIGGTGALINSNTGAAAAVSVDIAPSNSFTIGGAGDINLLRVGSANTGQFTLTMAGTGTVTTSGAGYNNLMSLVVNSGTFVLANTSGEAIDRNLTINGGTVRLSGANTDLISNAANPVTINGGVFDLNGKSETICAVGGTGGVIENLLTSTTSTLTVGVGDSSATYSGTVQNNSGSGGVLALTKTGSGTQTLTGANTYTGDTKVTAGTLALGNNLAIQNSAFDTSGAGVMSLSVTTPTFGGLKGGANLASVITTGYGGVTALTLNPGTGVTDTYSGVIADGASGMALTKSGAGTQILSGANTYTGATTVNAGVLSLTSAFLADTSTVTIGASGVLNLNYTGTDIVGTLILNGDTHTSGIYGAIGSGAPHETALITGTGKIQVGTLSGYALWSSTHGNQTPGEDYNNDGVKNGVEYFMGKTDNSFTANPGVVDGKIAWPKGTGFVGTYGTNYVVQTSSDLIIWTDVSASDSNLSDGSAGSQLVYTLPTGSDKLFVRLVVTP